VEKLPVPNVAGFEGCGEVINAKGENVKNWIGKRVSFSTIHGAWSNFAITNPDACFEI